MDYQVSARKFRPGAFDELIGQAHVVQTLRNAILQKQVAHAYLFSGMRGVGKTTAARILAKALNCEKGPTPEPCGECESCLEITRGNSVDVIEIDGASNTGVDDVRELRENVKFSPFRGAYRIYIIDEVHMLSNSAFNALLKTLEEPPSHAVFIFATTEAQKIPATITSRCQHFTFRRISRREIVARLQAVTQHIGVTIGERSLGAIAGVSEGSMRDALSLLDQAVAFGGTAIADHDVEDMLGAVPDELVSRLVDTVVNRNPAAAVELVGEGIVHGYDLRAWCGAVVERMRHLMIVAVVPGLEQAQRLMDVPVEAVEQVVKEAASFSVEQLQDLFHLFAQTEDRLRSTARPRFVFEMAVIRAAGVLQRNATPTTDAPKGQPQRSPAPVEKNKPGSGVPRSSSPPPKAQTSTPTQQTGKSESPQPDRSGQRAAAPSPRQGAALPPKQVASTPSVPSRVAAQRTTPAPSAPEKPSSPSSAPSVPSRVAAQRTTPAPSAPEKPSSPASAPVMRQEDWSRVVETVIDRHPGVGRFLEVGRFANGEGKEVVVEFTKSSSTACSSIQKEENRALITKVCQEVTGATIRLCVVELTNEPGDRGTVKQMREQQRRQDDEELLEHVRENPLVKQTRDLFGVEVVKASRASGTKEA